MNCVTVSPKYQIVIPANVRQSMNIRPGDKIQVLQFDGRIELVPMRPVKKLRGFLKGIAPEIIRDEDDRC
jgi:AbrB family looped-hinge helix DNA binding protein